MEFDKKEICVTQGTVDHTVSICWNGDFFQARLIHPPSPSWHEIGLGVSENDAINNLLMKINSKKAA